MTDQTFAKDAAEFADAVTALTTPAVSLEEIQQVKEIADALGIPQNPVDAAIQALLAALNLDQREVSQIDITAAGKIRIFGIDRSLRAAKATPLKRYRRDGQNRIVLEGGDGA